jgi:hypothetical protein
MWWLFDSAVHARDASKILGTLALCSQVLPVWLLARRVLDERLALIPAALSVAGTWMLMSALTITEVLALPLSTAALCATAIALQRPGSRAGHLAILFALLAIWARVQLVILIPVLLVAFTLDVLRVSARRRDRLRAHRPFLIVTGALTAGLAIASQVAASAAGDYASVLHTSAPPAGLILRKTGLELLELAAISGFLPVLLAAAVALSPRMWRDDRIGPLLIVFWLAALATALQSGAYLASNRDIPAGIERYVAYAVPIALVLAIVLLHERQLLPRWSFPLAALLALPLLAMPPHEMVVIEAAVWSTAHRVHMLTGLGRPEALAVAGVIAVVAAWVATRRRPGVGAVLAAATVILTVLAVQDQAAWRQMTSSWTASRALLPQDLAWVDHRGAGPVAVLVGHHNSTAVANVAYYNRTITQAFAPEGALLVGPPLQGTICGYRITAGGVLAFSELCGPVPQRLLLQDRMLRMRFYDETASVRELAIGRLVGLQRGHPPRLQSQLTLPCETPALPKFNVVDGARTLPASRPRPCEPAVQMSFWLDHPGKVTLVFEGTARDHRATVGTTTYTLRAHRLTRVAGDVPSGDSQFTLKLDWNISTGPRLIKAQLHTGGITRSLIY